MLVMMRMGESDRKQIPIIRRPKFCQCCIHIFSLKQDLCYTRQYSKSMHL